MESLDDLSARIAAGDTELKDLVDELTGIKPASTRLRAACCRYVLASLAEKQALDTPLQEEEAHDRTRT
jgi:hypothetical protein